MIDWRYIGSMTREREQLVVHFLEAMVMLLYLQKPEVVKNMTVSDWLNRTYIEGNHEHAIVEVDKCNAFFVMSNEEEAWFDTYYEYLRSEMIKRRHTRCSLDEAEKFFISSSGNPVDNPSQDLKELHDEYWLPSITTDMARSSVYAAMLKCDLIDDEKLSRPAEPKWMNANTAFHLLKMSHPVTVHATLPEKAARMRISRKYESHCLSLWCANQKKLRVGLVLDTFGLRQPSERKVHSWIEKQGWMENVPDAAELVKDWKPPRTIQAATDSKYIRRMSRKQCWKGLQVMDIEGKGPRVVTTRPFACGEVICDYHGRLISREEGLEIYQNSEGEAGHLFFFTDKNGQLMCLDAHEEHCECHPDKTTFGRQIKHSAKRANLSPRLYSVEDEPVILFMSTRNIQRGEEIRYDYGDNKRSYAGDGLDLMPS
ncbi:uncharacterized protein LOC127517408 isoform X4 [Ctenopharyngodon idella]|uniref:uncharacterized protein LOC127517408 isoform X3 n=1 Tax=Ctenopharyngodon idella TaxID=7959 RepID=UPI00222F3A0C|nr:uncharacterized protein LOC127517408 isoform X3 [Ctenopharyngodon idella]XP_051758929.1 uncharacterized protein LOC127517408 isoform X4 [Ctenopharyngodon idella]